MSSTKQSPAPPKVLPPICTGCRVVCPGGCLPGFCINARCPFHVFAHPINGRPEHERKVEHERNCLRKAKGEFEKRERFEFLNKERRIVGMREIDEETHYAGMKRSMKHEEKNDPSDCPVFSRSQLKSPDVPKSMRAPARAACQLQSTPFTPPTGDYAELSCFLRISTMPGCTDNDNVSEYKDKHNMSVWNNKKGLDRQVYKFKKDWLSNWGEFNVKEQRWRKAWVEKFGGEAFSK